MIVGKEIFAEALAAGTATSFFSLIEVFSTQDEPAFCGLASLAMVLNSLAIGAPPLHTVCLLSMLLMHRYLTRACYYSRPKEAVEGPVALVRRGFAGLLCASGHSEVRGHHTCSGGCSRPLVSTTLTNQDASRTAARLAAGGLFSAVQWCRRGALPASNRI